MYRLALMIKLHRVKEDVDKATIKVKKKRKSNLQMLFLSYSAEIKRKR